MALRVWLPLNGNPDKLDNLSDLVKNIGTSGDIVPTRVGTHHSFSPGGKLGYALNFIGAASDYLYIPGLKLQTFSWACWFKCTNNSTATSQRILSEGRDTGSRGAEIWVSQSGTTLYLQAHGITHSTTIELNKWYHVAFTCGDGVFNSYLNGNLINSSTYTADCDYAQSNDKFVIGKMAYSYTSTSNYFPFIGQINDVRIYDHCLSTKEVKEISQGLILHYKLDGFSGGVGENILTGTNYNSYSSSLNATTAINANGKWCGGSGGNGTFSVTEDFTCPVGNLSWNISNNTSGNRDFQQGDQPYVSGQQYTTSFWAKGNGTCLYRSWNSTDGKQMFSKTWTLTTDWAYYTHTFTASAEMETDLCTFHLGVTGNSNISICGMKMEKGSIATAWSPAPQDFGIDTSKITDASGYGNDGIIFGNVTTKVNDSNEGRYGISTYIPLGSTDFIGTWDSIGNPSDAITMSIWFKSSNTSPGNGYHEIFNHANSSQYFEFAIQNTGLFRGGMVINGTRYVANTAQLGLLDGNWHMLSMTYDGTTIVRYVDGISRSTTSVTGELTGADGVFLFGHYGPNTSYHAKEAYLADARIYATALSAEDIADLYHTPANIDNLGGVHGFEFIEKTPNLLNPDPREWTKESSVTCVWNEETGYFDVNTNRDTSVTSRWGVYTGVPIKPDTAYLFSAEVLDNKSYIGVAGGTSSRSLPSNIISWNGEKRYYYFFTTSSSHTHAWVYLCSKPSETTAGHFKNIYLGEVGEIASIKQNGIFENEDMVEYNENGRITKSGELAGSNFIEK